MSKSDCIAEITAAAGRALSLDELNKLYEDLGDYISKRQRIDKGASYDAIVQGAADDYAKDVAEAALIEKRNAAINLRQRLETVDFVRSHFSDDPALGLEARLVGVNRPVKGAGLSAAGEQAQLKGYYLGGFVADMEKKGLWPHFVTDAYERDIARALWADNRKEPISADVPREAAEMAKIVSKWQEVARQDANQAGAWIKRLEGYIVRQSHDMYAIRAAGFDAWRDFILPKLDAEKTFGEGDPQAILNGAWEGLASGVHLTTRDQSPSGFKGPRNIAKKVSAERELHFKSADDWFDYNQQFGARTLREAVLTGLEHNAHATGLMRRMGVNPEANLNLMGDEILKGVSTDEREKFRSALNGRLANQLKAVDGRINIPVDHMVAKSASYVRAITRMAKLAGSLLSQFSDIPLYGSEMRYQGRSMLGGMAESIGALFKGKGPQECRELAGMIGAFADASRGEIMTRFSVSDDGIPGSMAKLQALFFKWNGMTWWSDRQRIGAMFAMSHQLALHKGKEFSTLNPDLQRVLNRFAIGEPEWKAMRGAATKLADGREHMTPEAMPTRELADKLRSYLIERASYAQTMPDARTRAMTLGSTQPGTKEGEFWRFIWEFKSFTAAVTQKSLGREIYGRGSKTLREALHNGHGEMTGLANLIVWSTAFGYLSMVAKDYAKGKMPRDPEDPKTWVAALAQGGGFGIYGDFLFGEADRFGGKSFWKLAAGPSLGTFSDLYDLYTKARDGDDTAASAFRLAIQNTPFINMFYAKLAFDYLFLWSIQEWLNPGSLSRMESRVKHDNGQEFWLRPSSRNRTVEQALH